MGRPSLLVLGEYAVRRHGDGEYHAPKQDQDEHDERHPHECGMSSCESLALFKGSL
jgi:hypothetical protein